MRKRLLIIVVAALVPLTLPSRAHASLNLESSMTASCVGLGGACDQVVFALNIPSTQVWVDMVRLFSFNATWVFSHLIEATDHAGNVLDWKGTLGNSDLMLKGSGVYGAEPIFMKVAMSAYSTADFLYYKYSGQGNTSADGMGDDVSFGGTVTPEPVSMVLLGSGMAGIAGAARRRRRKDQENALAD